MRLDIINETQSLISVEKVEMVLGIIDPPAFREDLFVGAQQLKVDARRSRTVRQSFAINAIRSDYSQPVYDDAKFNR